MSGTLTLAQFIVRTTAMVAEVHHATEHALEHAARVVEKEAKAEIGTYQDAVGPFSAWAELADATKVDRLRLGFSENDPGLRTGEMRNSIGHKVHMAGPAGAGEAHVGSDDDKMVFFELGTIKQPARTVLAGSTIRKVDEIKKICGEAVVAALIGPGSVRRL